MKKLLDFIVKSIVSKTENVEIFQTKGKKTTLYEIKIDKNDIGKIIGKNGSTLEAINTLLSVASVKNNKKSVLEIID
ncbi:KH domain-containing protein [candidate division WOR-3 bacterium]|nr:KH domain-containing protein [candidate division WOR-3 bacterium]